jgi:chromosome segregation ATPase
MANPPGSNGHKKLGSLRKLATLQTLANGAKPRERHHLANRFARLENERARLERELSSWENCKQATTLKLAKVNEEIASLRAALFEPAGKRAIFRKGHGQRRAPTTRQVREPTLPRHRAITLEY